ncbi:MAG: 5-formyltetrahydrofolate cyclo-ligase [Novosphingobium sp.]|nr:5-formyltetrahydrofolate cyclo-ligase [Novosphingobium sp.]
MDDKPSLRRRLRKLRREHVAGLSETTRALLFLRPPAVVSALAAEGTTIGLYHATADEAPTRGYAKWFSEHGRHVALPWFAAPDAPMRFRAWADPYADEGLVPGPFGALQPADDAPELDPDVVFVPLLGFTRRGERLGQGGGHYDRWLAAHPGVTALGLGWDCQELAAIGAEAHDHPLCAVITPTCIHEALP